MAANDAYKLAKEKNIRVSELIPKRLLKGSAM